MELKKAVEWCRSALKKENALRLTVALGLCGIALLAFSSLGPSTPKPQEAEQEVASDAAYAQALEQNLARIVTAITGEKAPAVMVTLENTGRRVYAADQRESSQSGEGGDSQEKESSHVLFEDAQGGQQPLTVTQVQPKIQGVVIVSSRASDPATREKLVNAAKTALGIPSSRVCVVG